MMQGIDKDSLNSDFIDMLKHNYIKILCINLKTKSHEDIFLKYEKAEKDAYAEDIDKWLWDFADKSYVHAEDIAYYKQNTDIDFLRSYFEKYDEPFGLMYRRLRGEEYKWVEMSIVKSKGYTRENPIVILYVMDAERYVSPVYLENQGIYDCFNIVMRFKGTQSVSEMLRYLCNFYNADDVFVCDKEGGILYECQPNHAKSQEGQHRTGIAIDEHQDLVIINPNGMQDCHLLYRCVAFIIHRVLLDEEISRKYIIEKRQNRIINALSKRFFTIYRVDMNKNEAYLVYAPEYVKNLISGKKNTGEILDIVENNLVEKEYRETIHEFNDYTKWSEKLGDSDNISMEFKGVNRWARAVIIVAQRDEDGRASEVLYAVQDIEAQKLREAEQEFKLREALSKAKEASQAKSLFLSNMSHDIRTPMNAIVGFAKLAKENSSNPAMVDEYLDEITIAGKHLVSLINEILDMSHIESGKMELNPAPSNIRDILNNIGDIMKLDVLDKNIKMELCLDGISHEQVLCDEIKLNQILFNLIGNSVKYNKPGGSIRLSCKELPSESGNEGIYEFVVEDTGVGMSKDFLGKIFDTFERESDTTTSNIQGTGLGMPITKGVVELMGGTIHIESEKNVGTTCTVTIPFTWITYDDTKVEDNVESTETLLAKLKGVRALLVEDNLVNQKLAEAIFKSLGLALEISINGKEALDTLEDKEDGYYDVVLMDMQMPVMDGLEATAAIRAHKRKAIANIPIIMMTANAFEEDRKKSFDAGANGYVAKPINVDILVQEMAREIKR